MLVRCETCKGKGHVFVEGWGITVSCDVCHGKGGFDVPAGKELCPVCKGKRSICVPTPFGFQVEEGCKNCFSTGFIDKVEE